jgi:fructose-bisphosphate aldolase class II
VLLKLKLSSILTLHQVQNKSGYLQTQVGNPEGDDKPNKKYYDPRVWVREGEKTMSKRLAVALDDFYAAGKV